MGLLIGSFTKSQVQNHLNNNIETLDLKETSMKKFKYLKKACTSYHSIDQVKESEFRLIEDPICIINSKKEILIHLEQLNDDNAIIKVKEVIDNYYFHILEHLLHRSITF